MLERGIPDDVFGELLHLLDGPDHAFWPGVERVRDEHPDLAATIHAEAEKMWAARGDKDSRGPLGWSGLRDEIADAVHAMFFGPDAPSDPSVALSALCARHHSDADKIERLASWLREQIEDLHRRLGDVWSLSRTQGRYEPIGELAGGGFGSVTIVRDRLLGRRVALKTIHARHGSRLNEIAPWKVHRFLDEAQIAAQLQHPGIPLVHDLGIGSRGVPYYTMRYVRGATLAARLEASGGRCRPGALPDAVRQLVVVAEAVAYAHTCGVLHRDLKPANVVIGRFGEVCVIDWGLARAGWQPMPRDADPEVRTDRGVDLGSGGMGSEGFIAPEQRRGEFHPAGDVFSLAAILHVFLTGSPPLLGDGAERYALPKAAFRHHRRLANVCQRGVAPRLADRYSTMAAFLDDLRRCIAHRGFPRSARSIVVRLQDRWRRWRARPGSTSERADDPWPRTVSTSSADPPPTFRNDLTMATRAPGLSLGKRTVNATGAERPTSRRLDHLERRLEAFANLSTPTPRFRPAATIGKGGMAEILRMHDALLRRDVAVKKSLHGLAADRHTLARLLDEAQIAAQLDHPAIVGVHEIGVDEGGIRIVMPWIRGNDLAAVLRQRLPWQESARMLLQATWGLAFAHRKGVVHRDVKPANILLGVHGDAYLADWGLAMLLPLPGSPESRIRVQRGLELDDGVDETVNDESDPTDTFATVSGVIAGTPAYMAPECARGDLDTIRAHSDIWSLGVVLYECLTGRHPYVERFSSSLDILHAHASGPLVIASVRQVAPRVPRRIAALCERALERNPLDRFRDAGEFAAALAGELSP